jgi:hypothetical protein
LRLEQLIKELEEERDSTKNVADYWENHTFFFMGKGIDMETPIYMQRMKVVTLNSVIERLKEI